MSDFSFNTCASITCRCTGRWGLLNEPRCKGSIRNMDGKTSNGGLCHPAIQAWIEEMSATMKVSLWVKLQSVNVCELDP